jgi:hypothetical protein
MGRGERATLGEGEGYKHVEIEGRGVCMAACGGPLVKECLRNGFFGGGKGG